ncbi:hypothetical protein OG618_36830 [Kitasatospora sp. NBC_01246]|uniref:hypothetical protein n=1 Tax=Kitasatospora sp. NBC_01246 TaxID=2903570 RepID=UPI002E2F0C85|nr:hypothetical protein [Kitasatospora sp. NBC_01246]
MEQAVRAHGALLAGGHLQVIEVDLGGEQATGTGGHLDGQRAPQVPGMHWLVGLRIFSMPLSGACRRRSCSAVAIRNWNKEASTAQVISTSRVSPSGSAPVRALALVLVIGWALSLVVIAGASLRLGTEPVLRAVAVGNPANLDVSLGEQPPRPQRSRNGPHQGEPPTLADSLMTTPNSLVAPPGHLGALRTP